MPVLIPVNIEIIENLEIIDINEIIENLEMKLSHLKVL